MHTAIVVCVSVFVSDAKGSPRGSACRIGTERVVLCDSLLYLQMIELCL